jgi:hypothetical protein
MRNTQPAAPHLGYPIALTHPANSIILHRHPIDYAEEFLPKVVQTELLHRFTPPLLTLSTNFLVAPIEMIQWIAIMVISCLFLYVYRQSQVVKSGTNTQRHSEGKYFDATLYTKDEGYYLLANG